MTIRESDFLKILESFPGRKELTERTAILHYTNELSDKFDLPKLAKEIKEENLKVNLPREDDVWIKFIAFKNLVNAMIEFQSDCQEEELKEKEILSDESLKILEEIVKIFQKYDDSEKYQSSGDIYFYGLCRFVRDGKVIF